MPAITLTGTVVCPMGQNSRALELDTPAMAQAFRSWCRSVPIATQIATVTSITGPDDGGVPLVYFGAKAHVAKTQAGDRATIEVEDRKRKNGHGIETVDVNVF